VFLSGTGMSSYPSVGAHCPLCFWGLPWNRVLSVLVSTRACVVCTVVGGKCVFSSLWSL
jgi:hypothetical protein